MRKPTPATNRTIEAARQVGERGIEITSLELRTADGRIWNLTPVPAGRGRLAEGNWGARPGARAGFRLFEIDPDGRHGPEEHDCVDGDTWPWLGDLLDYLEAVATPAR